MGRRGNPFLKAFPSGEGGSRVPRKRETDEGLASSLWERCPGRGGEGVCLPSQSLRDSSPRVGAKGEADCHTSVRTGSQ